MVFIETDRKKIVNIKNVREAMFADGMATARRDAHAKPYEIQHDFLAMDPEAVWLHQILP
jgi:hypothetical protein